MKKTFTLRSFLSILLFFVFGAMVVLQGQTADDLIISGVIDGPLAGGTPKAIEFYVANDISDLSHYGFGSANNGGGSDGQEFTFPAVTATRGDYIYVATETTGFTAFFGFAPDYTSSAASINGDDAIELFFDGMVSDVFGDVNVDGTGEPWEYMDGWAYRVDQTGPDGSTFILANWTFSGPDALDGETTNASAATPWPIGSFVLPITLISFQATYKQPEVLLEWETAVELNNDYILIERSADGANYEQIGRVEGQGTTYVGHSYAFTDVQPLSGFNYYRLCQVDFDGGRAYHGPVVVKTEGGWSIYPTVVQDRLYLQWQEGTKNLGQSLHCLVTDVQGRSCLQADFPAKGASEHHLSVEMLAPGMYFLHWQQGGASGVFRFVKE